MAWNEASLHRWLARRPRARAALDFGNDAAVLAKALRHPVACVDAVVEGVHFEAGTSARLAGATERPPSCTASASAASARWGRSWSASQPSSSRGRALRRLRASAR